MWRIKLKIIKTKCYLCDKKAIALQQDIPTCMEHFSKLIHLKGIKV
jgi:hypothetical protein